MHKLNSNIYQIYYDYEIRILAIFFFDYYSAGLLVLAAIITLTSLKKNLCIRGCTLINYLLFLEKMNKSAICNLASC